MRGKALKWLGVSGGALMLACGMASAAPLAWAAAADGSLAAAAAVTAPTVARTAQVSTLASPYLWSATKAADGSISFDGHVPSKDVQDSLRDNVPKLGTDATGIAAGEPQGFVANAVSALDVLAALDSGKVAFDGGSWNVTGSVDSADKLAAAKAAFDNSTLKTIGASYAVNGPGTATLAPAPNYAWSVEKAGDGMITFNGTVPDDELKRFLLAHAGAKSLDNSTIAAGAPEGFDAHARQGLDALMQLESGKLLYAGGVWSLAGIASGDDARQAAQAALPASDAKDWHLDIKTPVRPAVVPPPPVAPEATAPATATPEASPATPSPAPAAPAPAASAESATATPAAPEPAASSAPAAPASTEPSAPAAPVTTEPAAPAASAPAAPSATAAPAAEATTPYLFHASKTAGGNLAATGQVPTAAMKTYLGNVTRDPAAAGITVTSGSPEQFAPDLLGGIDALARMTSGTLDFDGKIWAIKGRTETKDLEAIVVSRLALLPNAKAWTVDVTGPTPLELCQKAVAALPEGVIAFDRGTQFVKGTQAVIDALATSLAACPDVRVNVEAFTDSDGDKDANMALSVARAETVVAELVKRGVNPDRIYAVGYGETMPLVENTTKANKAKNRRVEIKLGDLDAK